MMELIERYVGAVAERLPEGTREDVARELRANIEDMLPDDAKEEDVRRVLEKLGNPAVLADEYRQAKRYLIGPAMYDTYVFVLKVVLCIATIALAFLSLIGTALDPGNGAVDLIAAAISGAIQGAMMAFLWVTLVFVILERTGALEGQKLFDRKEWTVEDLPPTVVNPKNKIDRTGEVVAIIFIVAFLSIFVLRPELFGWYDRTDSGLQVMPAFDIARLQTYIPAMVVLAVAGLGLAVWKIVAGRWTLPLAGANTVVNLGSGLLACLMLTAHDLVNPGLIPHMEDILGMSAGTLGPILSSVAVAAIVLFVLAGIMDSVMGFLKCGNLRLTDVPERIRTWMEAQRQAGK
jgi:hypothetical protein